MRAIHAWEPRFCFLQLTALNKDGITLNFVRRREVVDLGESGRRAFHENSIARPAGTELYIHMAFAEKRGKRHWPLPNQRRRKTTLIGSPTGLADISARLGRQDNRLICQ